MKKMTVAEFNSIPSFFCKGKECIDIDGKTYNKMGFFKLLMMMGMIEGGM